MNINRVKEQLGEAVSSLYKAVGDCESFPYNRNAYIKDAKRCIDRALGELQKTDWVSVNEELPEYEEKVVVRNAYYKSDEPWVTFRDIRDLFLKIQMISEKLLAQLVVVSPIGNIFKYKELWIRRKLKS